MTTIIDAIDAWTLNRYSAYQEKLYGFCELVTKTTEAGEQTFVKQVDSETKAVLDDRYTFITWIRWTSPVQYETSEFFSFGRKEARVGELPLRLILAHKTVLGEDVVFDFINAFPNKFSVSGYKFVFVNPTLSIDPDHEQIIRTELGPENYSFYERHRFTWNVYIINIVAKFLECGELTPTA